MNHAEIRRQGAQAAVWWREIQMADERVILCPRCAVRLCSCNWSMRALDAEKELMKRIEELAEARREIERLRQEKGHA